MENSKTTQSAAEKNAEKYFRQTERSETTAKQELKKEQDANAAKTAKLRELRLAKEAAEKPAGEPTEKT